MRHLFAKSKTAEAVPLGIGPDDKEKALAACLAYFHSKDCSLFDMAHQAVKVTQQDVEKLYTVGGAGQETLKYLLLLEKKNKECTTFQDVIMAVVQLRVETYDPKKSSGKAGGKENQGWSCDVCTLINVAGTKACNACGSCPPAANAFPKKSESKSPKNAFPPPDFTTLPLGTEQVLQYLSSNVCRWSRPRMESNDPDLIRLAVALVNKSGHGVMTTIALQELTNKGIRFNDADQIIKAIQELNAEKEGKLRSKGGWDELKVQYAGVDQILSYLVNSNLFLSEAVITLDLMRQLMESVPGNDYTLIIKYLASFKEVHTKFATFNMLIDSLKRCSRNDANKASSGSAIDSEERAARKARKKAKREKRLQKKREEEEKAALVVEKSPLTELEELEQKKLESMVQNQRAQQKQSLRELGVSGELAGAEFTDSVKKKKKKKLHVNGDGQSSPLLPRLGNEKGGQMFPTL